MTIRTDTRRPAEILLVEDDNDDVELARIGFETAGFAVNLHRVENGEECMAFLRREGDYVDARRPDIILLDLNLPRMNGREVLAEIDGDRALRHFPVIVLTSSAAPDDVLDCYRLRCSSYVVKPIEFEKFQNVVRFVSDYWFLIAKLPFGPNFATKAK